MNIIVTFKKVLRKLIRLLYEYSICNFYPIYSIKLGQGVVLKKTQLARNTIIASNSCLTNSAINGTTKIDQNCTISYSTIDGVASIKESCKINKSKVIGNVTIGPQSIISGATIHGNFHSQEQLRLYGPDITITGNVEIGRYTSLNGPNFDIFCSLNKVKIGSFCSIARNVSIQERSHHTDRISTYYINKNVLGENIEKDITSKGDIVIENDVWIGAHCVVLSGAHISTGAIVAANSVVTGFVPPYAIVGGSPAKVIKYRFNQDTINTLLKSAWWEWSVEKIKAHKELFNLSLSTPEAIQDLQNILSTK